MSDQSVQKMSDMVLIPAGTFLMGGDVGADCSPVHEVSVDAFYMDMYQVTNARYLAFCQAAGHRLPEFWGMDVYHSTPDYPEHPVVGVSWRDAAAYAGWCGKRLPTEAEWEYASRGGLIGKPYPNGDDIDPALANYRRSELAGTVPVGRYPPNGYGLYDMVGNVAEWVEDYYGPEYYAVSPLRNPRGPAQGKFRVIRGGGWHTGPGCCRVFFRNALPENWKDINVGFRCARDAGG